MSAATNCGLPSIAQFVEAFEADNFDQRHVVEALCRRSTVAFLNKPFCTPTQVHTRHRVMTLILLSLYYRAPYLDILVEHGAALCRKDGLHDQFFLNALHQVAPFRRQRAVLHNFLLGLPEYSLKNKFYCFLRHFDGDQLAQQIKDSVPENDQYSDDFINLFSIVHRYGKANRVTSEYFGRSRRSIDHWDIVCAQRAKAIAIMIVCFQMGSPALIVARLLKKWDNLSGGLPVLLDEARLYRITTDVYNSCRRVKLHHLSKYKNKL